MLKDHDKRILAPNDKGLNVRKRCCGRCLFSKNALIKWEPYGREKIEKALAEDTTFTCHEYQNVICRGFFDRYKNDVLATRLAVYFNKVHFVDQPKEKEVTR